MTVDGQEAYFIPAGSGQTIQLNQINQMAAAQGGQQIQIGPNGQIYAMPKQEPGTSLQSIVNAAGPTTFITPSGQIAQIAGQQPQQTFVTPTGQIIRAPANMIPAANFIPQAVQFPMATQTIPVQVPISLGNGQTVYQTVQVRTFQYYYAHKMIL